jgi:phospholipid/cholesterol/gamma-HCH transport system substrate-binding protein
VAKQLSGVVHDNESKLAPTLKKLNSVTAMLEKNRDNLSKALPGLAKYQLTAGEAASSGFAFLGIGMELPFFPQVLQPFFDYYFGFRANGAPGSPPDNAGPRALFPFPSNGIPGGSR